MKVELACRCVKFIVKRLSSSNSVVKHVARQGVYIQRLHFPIGRNAPRCISTVDADITAGKLPQAGHAHNDAWLTDRDRIKFKLITELLSIKHHYCSLDMFNADEVDVAIKFLCTT